MLEASPKGHYTHWLCNPGWYNETVDGKSCRAMIRRGERLFVGLQNARLYNGDQRIETQGRGMPGTAKRLIGLIV